MKSYGAILEAIDRFVRAGKVFGPYTRQDGRQIVIVRNDDNSCRTVSYPKYIMEQHMGRQLDPNKETVDHIDRDHSNNDINNLRIVPRSQHSKDDTRRVKLVEFDCSMCGKKFQRSPRLVRDKSKKGKRGLFCSRHCAGQYARRLQLGLISKFPVQPYLESEYYRNVKNLASVAARLLEKYGLDRG
jgi:hypothetical protein